ILRRADPLPEDYAASQVLNREFHLALARAGQNAVLEDLLAPLLNLKADGAAHRFSREFCRATWVAHHAIHDAIAARDLAAADRAIIRHFEIGPIALQEIAARSAAAAPPRGARRPRR